MSENNKRNIAIVILFILIGITILLTYLKYFQKERTAIQEIPVNESNSKAIHDALKEITTNFNQNYNLKEYVEVSGDSIIASVNNYSIYISYIANVTTTYEFTYDNLCLNITIRDDEDNNEKFSVIYKFLIEAVQTRINNASEFDSIINNILNNDISYEGLSKEKTSNAIEYKIDITKKLRMEE